MYVQIYIHTNTHKLNRHTDAHRHTETDTHTDTPTHSNAQTHIDTQIHIDTQAHRHTQIHIHTDGESNRHTARHTDEKRKTGGWVDGRTDGRSFDRYTNEIRNRKRCEN